MTDNTETTPPTRRSAGRIIARNTVLGLGAQAVLRVISFLFNILVIRQLGDAQFGQYSIVVAWTGLFSVIGDLGITQYFAREIAREPEKTSELFWDMVALRGLLAVVAAVITTGASLLNPAHTPEIALAVFLYTLTYFLQAFLVPLQSVLTGYERVDLIWLFGIIGQVIFMGAAGLFLFSGKDFVWLVIASFLNLPILIGLNLWIIRRNHYGPPRFRLNTTLWWSIIRYGLPFGFTQLALSFSFRVDTIILNSAHFSNHEIGWYNIAYGLTLNIVSLMAAFNTAILPTLAREHATDPQKVLPWYYRSVKVILFIGLPIAVGGMLLAEPLMTTLYTPANRAAYIAFFIIIWDLPIVMYTSFCGNLTTSIRQENGAARIYISLGVINVLINLILIPSFGMIGSAFATVLTDLCGAALFYILFRREFGSGLGLKYLLRLALSAALMGLAVMLLSQMGLQLFIVVPAAAAIYLVLVWVTQSFTPDERSQFIGLAQRLTRRFSRA